MGMADESTRLRELLREVLRIERAAEEDATSIPFDEALDGRLKERWLVVKGRIQKALRPGPVGPS